MMENLDPKDAHYKEGSVVLKELRILKDAEYEEAQRVKTEISDNGSSDESSGDSSQDSVVQLKRPMTYEEFSTDPFGTKKQANKNYNKKNKNAL